MDQVLLEYFKQILINTATLYHSTHCATEYSGDGLPCVCGLDKFHEGLKDYIEAMEKENRMPAGFTYIDRGDIR